MMCPSCSVSLYQTKDNSYFLLLEEGGKAIILHRTTTHVHSKISLLIRNKSRWFQKGCTIRF